MKNKLNKILLEFNQYIKSIKIEKTNTDYVFDLFIKYISTKNYNQLQGKNPIQIKKDLENFSDILDISLSDLLQLYYCGDCNCFFLPFIDDNHLTMEDTETYNVCGKCSIHYKECNCNLFVKKENKCLNCD